MLAWLTANIGTIIICVILAAIVTAIIVKLRKDRKQGKSACGNNCAHCAMAGACHKQK